MSGKKGEKGIHREQEGKGLDPVDYNPETSHPDISYSIVRKSSIRPSFESLELTQRPKILEATYLATVRLAKGCDMKNKSKPGIYSVY